MADEARARSASIIDWKGEVAGGTAGALVSFTIALPLGTLALAPLGPRYAAVGVVAGLSCAIFGGFVAALLGGTPALRTGPMTAVCLILAALIGDVAHPSIAAGSEAIDATRVLAIAFASVIFGGVVQAGLGAARLGTAIKFVPYPVIAGFRNGLAVLIVLAQIPPLFGLSHALTAYDWLAFRNTALPWNVLVAAVAASAVFAARAAGMKAFAPLLGIVAGTLAHYALQRLLSHDSLGALVGTLPAIQLLPAGLTMIVGTQGGLRGDELVQVLLSATGIAVVGSTLSLLAARVVDDATGTRHDSNRELIGQGLGNVVSGCFGGVPGAGSPSTSVANHQAGGRTRISAGISSLLQLSALSLGASVIATLPLAALAGVMLPVAADVADAWSLRLLFRLRDTLARKRELAGDLVVVCIVAIVTVLVNLIVAVLVGLLITAAVFAAKISKPAVRRVYSGDLHRSLRQRNAEQTAVLQAQGSCITVFELEGPLFFGTADRVSQEVESRTHRSRYVVLDFRRVNALDATATRLLQQLAHNVERRGGTLMFAGIASGSITQRMVDAMHEAHAVPEIHWFVDSDRALEWCEDQLLHAHAPDSGAETELALEDTDLCNGFTPAEIGQFYAVVRRESYVAGSFLFRRGDQGTTLYLIVKGAVSIILPGDERTSVRRLVTFREGVIFGELAVLRDRPRSADALFETDSVVYSLSRANLDMIGERNPALASKFYRAVSLMLAQRLTDTTGELRELER